MSASAYRLFRRTKTVFAFPAEIFFDDAVFQRVEGNDCQPPAGPQACYRLGKHVLNSIQFLIHCYAQGLECPRGGVNMAFSRDDGFDNGSKLERCLKRSRLDDGLRDAPGGFLFSIAVDQVRQLILRQAVDQVCRAGGGGRVKAHVQRRIVLEGEAALRRIQLHGGKPQVEQDAIHCIPADLSQRFRKRVIGGLDQTDALPVRSQVLTGKRERLRVYIQP